MRGLFIRYILCLCLGALLLVGGDYYVQNILSPWNQKAPEKEIDPEEVKPKKKKKKKKSEPEKIEPEQIPQPIVLDCKAQSSRLRFVNYDRKKMEMTFHTCDSILASATTNREKTINGNFYQPLLDHDAPHLKQVVAQYQKNIDSLKYKKTEAAQFVCASIQSIPYTLVHPFSHRKAAKLYPYVEEYHRTMKKPMESIGGCVENIDPYGVMSPLETLFTQKADCDSRTIFLYLVLKALGFDVIQLSSSAEGHAILGVNVPKAYGNVFYKYKGKKYYIVETTFYHRKQSRIGVHKEGRRYMRNWNLWKVDLD